MSAQVITIGDEILIGQIVDTNSAFISKKLNEAGIQVTKKIAIGDSEKEIIQVIDEAFKNSNIIIVTGGLGPTKDDVTKNTLVKYFNSPLRSDEATY
ncbi:MAG: damage-inducible protein CinA, partial [Bacteroidia bacterium]|nr:damage-inducible protein CinA [Bacteroidia bacterium]